MDIPDAIQERLGSSGVGVFKQGHKAGKLEGAKVAKDQVATDLNTIANAVVNAKKKDDYESPDVDQLATMAGQIFARGKPDPDKNGVKRFLLLGAKVMDGLPNPPKPESKPKPKPASP